MYYIHSRSYKSLYYFLHFCNVYAGPRNLPSKINRNSIFPFKKLQLITKAISRHIKALHTQYTLSPQNKSFVYTSSRVSGVIILAGILFIYVSGFCHCNITGISRRIILPVYIVGFLIFSSSLFTWKLLTF